MLQNKIQYLKVMLFSGALLFFPALSTLVMPIENIIYAAIIVLLFIGVVFLIKFPNLQKNIILAFLAGLLLVMLPYPNWVTVPQGGVLTFRLMPGLFTSKMLMSLIIMTCLYSLIFLFLAVAINVIKQNKGDGRPYSARSAP